MLIWLRKYPTLVELSSQFGIPVTSVHRIIHKILPIFHVTLVKKYVKWPSHAEWHALAGGIPEWPHVVAILDGTPFRISRPAGMHSNVNQSLLYMYLHPKIVTEISNFVNIVGTYQRVLYRRDRHCFF